MELEGPGERRLYPTQEGLVFGTRRSPPSRPDFRHWPRPPTMLCSPLIKPA